MMEGDIKIHQSVQLDDLSNANSFQLMIEHSPLGVIILGHDSIKYSNDKFAHIIGASCKTALAGKSITEYIHPSYQKFFYDWLQKIPGAAKHPNNIEMILLKNNNDLINVEVCGSDIRHKEHALTQLYIKDITERKRVETELKYLASSDSPSNLINDNLLQKYLGQAIKSAALSKRHVAVVYMDLDHLKLVNETYGYKIGDLLLQAVTQRLKKISRQSDMILPFGGEKFVLVMNDLQNISVVSDFIQNLTNSLSQPFRINDNNVYTTITAGISVFPENGVDSDTILKNAELAHYYAKQQGQNNYRYYSSSMSRHIHEKTELLYDLRQALNQHDFRLLYQPVIDTSTGKIIGLEALLRWHRLKKTMLAPNDFLSLAEESGLIFDIGEWVIETACNQNLVWQQSGITPLPISINLSTRQFHAKSGLINIIKTALKETKLSPQLIEFEMSENVTVLDIGSDILQELKQMGIRLTIDDFGASYFSLNELKRYYIDTIKIDRSLIKSVPYDADKSLIVSAIIAMGNTLGLDIICEGIETDEQLMFIKKNGCYKVQGNLLCRPMSPEELYPVLSGKKPLLVEASTA